MFRTMRRFNQQLSEAECISILQKEKRGVLAVIGDQGYPYALPIDFVYDSSNGKIYFHGAKAGHKIDAIAQCDKVSFCVCEAGSHQGDDWALTVRSVVIFGRLKPVQDPKATAEAALQIARRFYPDEASAQDEVRKAGDRVLCLALTIEHMTGKKVHEA